jgi:putative FmdB family regulatory protein
MVTTYQYRCDQDGLVDVIRPMGTAQPREQCPRCEGIAVRVFSPPRLSFADRGIMAAIDATKRSADAPEVVTSLPSHGRRRRQPMAPPNPALQRLPRP